MKKAMCVLPLAALVCASVSFANDAADEARYRIERGIERGPNIAPPWLGDITTTEFDGNTDDLLTAGLGRTGLGGAAPAVTDATDPRQLRKLAIWSNYRAVLDITPNGGYGRLYGPNIDVNGNDTLGEGKIAGTEYLAFSDRGRQRKDSGQNVTLLVQVPASFNPAKACIITGTSSGSRGIYGAIGSSGEWGLKRGCAVAYTDKGTGLGVHDLQNNTVNLINGVRVDADAAGDYSNFTARIDALDRQQFNAALPNRFAVKHAHSQQNPEMSWGRDTLRAIEFAFYVLNEKFGMASPGDKKQRTITPSNTIVIASSISNGAGAALAAAEQDRFGLIDGVAVSEPNIQIDNQRAPIIKRGSLTYSAGAKPLFDYFTFANLYQPCAVLSTRAAGAPFAAGVAPAIATNRCAALAAKGLLNSTTTAAQADEALDKLLAYGWEPDTILLHASHYALATPAIAMTYANSYGRFSVLENLCGLSFAGIDATGSPAPAVPAALAVIFGNGNGVPPTGPIQIINNNSVGGAKRDAISVSPSTNQQDFNIDGALCQRNLWTGDDKAARLDAVRVKVGVKQVQQRADLNRKPTLIVHGRADTLIPVNFTSRPYFAENKRREGRSSRVSYVEVTNAQHFDAFLGIAGFDTRYVPLHVYFNRALDAMWDHLSTGAALPPSQVVRTTPRGGTPGAAPAITGTELPPIRRIPAAGDVIGFDRDSNTLTIPD